MSSSRCWSCDLPYEDFGGDLNVPDDIWKSVLSPTKDQYGLLCPGCIVHELGLRGGAVHCTINGDGNYVKKLEKQNDALRRQLWERMFRKRISLEEAADAPPDPIVGLLLRLMFAASDKQADVIEARLAALEARMVDDGR